MEERRVDTGRGEGNEGGKGGCGGGGGGGGGGKVMLKEAASALLVVVGRSR